MAENSSQPPVDKFETTKKVLKGFSIGVAVILLALGILGYVFLSLSDPINIILPAYYILFGCLIIIGECKMTSMTVYFKFIDSYFGRGVYYVL
mmetsp:Transcript_31535/g.54643  ORF Transcript_31535/g.54643 Transcript_31535/m.54643 type:complete len:93 (-) Transcript_31535:199-477(-)